MTDKQFLKWIHARLVNEHDENPQYDYMSKLMCIADAQPEHQITPNIFRGTRQKKKTQHDN